MDKVKNVKELRGFLKGMSSDVEREIGISSPEMKSIVKDVVTEILESRPELIKNAVLNAMEDIALSKAIEEGDKKDYVSYDKLMKVMDKKINEAE